VHMYPMYDGTGNTRKLVDNGGGGPAGYTYDAFGRYLYGWQNVTNPFRYGGTWGYITDTPGSGLLQLGHRYYWPEVGRFVQQDPMGDGMNWYAYVGNNPVVWVDPEGFGVLDTLKKPFEAVGAWIGDLFWPDESDPDSHPCPTGGALMIGGLATAGAGYAATAVGDAAAKAGASSPFWSTAGAVAKGVGYGAALAGGVVSYYQTKAKAEEAAGALQNRLRNPSGIPGENIWDDPDAMGGRPEDFYPGMRRGRHQ